METFSEALDKIVSKIAKEIDFKKIQTDIDLRMANIDEFRDKTQIAIMSKMVAREITTSMHFQVELFKKTMIQLKADGLI